MNETNDGWNFDVTVDPKPRISGHVKLKKVLKGDAVDRSDVFQFQLNIADGEYKATMSDGSNRTVKNGDVINLKADEEITIFNLPEQSDYSFKELNYDEKGYQPSYSKTDGKVEGKSTISSVVTNTKNKNVSTNVKNKSLIFMEIAGGALTVLIVLIALKKNSSRSQ